MGAKQRAQNRGKKAAKGSMKGQPGSQKSLNKSISVPDLKPGSRASALQSWNTFSASASPPNRNGFSMSEEARNTDKRGFGWSSIPLRHTGIKFVSAGNLKREEDAWNTASEDESPQKQLDAEVPTQSVLHNHDNLPSKDTAVKEVPEILQQPDNIVIGARPNSLPSEPKRASVRDIAVPKVRPPTPGSDSEEEILFVGRHASQQPSRIPSPAPPTLTSKEPETNVLPKSPIAISSSPQESSEQPIPRFSNITLGLDSTTEISGKSRRESTRENDLPYGRKYTEDELMQDYIDNMALGGNEESDTGEEQPNGSSRKAYKKTTTYRLFSGDGLENAKVQTKPASRPPRLLDIPNQAFDWESDDLEIFDDASTTDEELEDISQVLRRRERPSGSQYLVLATGVEISDAKWVLHSKLVSENAVKEIRIYEEIQAMNVEEEEENDDEDDEDDESDEEDEEALRDLIGDIESEDDENARIIKYTAGMTDEQIARMLAKQEELGLGSDELILLDGATDEIDDDLLGDAFGADSNFIPFRLSTHTSNRTRSKWNKKKRDSFPSAEAFADALEQDPYGAFDVMDFDRPSLRPKKKGRKSEYPFDLEALEDEDLREDLINTWTKDREKKAARKREREEARLKASLDMADNSDPAIIKHRIRQFLVNDADVLELTPMEAPVRAAVHRLAKALKLNSASRGKEGVGLGRYPVLTKTPRTPHYDSETIWEIDALMNTRKFFPKNLYSYKYKSTRHTAVAVKSRRGGGGVSSGVRFMDGDVVAASAPELGSENRGRAMLEKMGWVAGTGIGAVGNKGMLDPIRHTIKTTKAGLG